MRREARYVYLIVPMLFFGSGESLRAISPEESVKNLNSESYPTRAAAVASLKQWAAPLSDRGKSWVLDEFESSENPEVRLRLLDVLREIVIADLRKQRPGFVGIQMATFPLPGEMEGRFGIRIVQVTPDSPAERALLRQGELIVGLNGSQWADETATSDFAETIAACSAGDTVTLGVLRGDGDVEEINVTLAPRPWSAGEYASPQSSVRYAPHLSESEAEARVFKDWLEEFQGDP